MPPTKESMNDKKPYHECGKDMGACEKCHTPVVLRESMNITTMEERFNEEFDKYLFIPEDKYEIMIDVESSKVKTFVRQELLRQSEEYREAIEKMDGEEFETVLRQKDMYILKSEILTILNNPKE